jgi:two-component system sensor histidine kinase KdpD
MCAGVGKTYAMLQEAHERQRSGAELVIGYVETHGRVETEALRDGLEELPPRIVEYRGVQLKELDLDAALARRPGVLLVDELAHSNAEGLRHTKRWQDVAELLEAGIDVHTAVNVQHLESLNDIVAQITGIPVRETVPDSFLERADEIELIDIPPDDLLTRLREGKVYVPDQARQAVDRFFRKDNLVALRELALRQAAERVAAQVQVERAGRGDARPWVTADRILVCVGPSPLSARVVRTARRMATSAHAEWVAVGVETPGLSPISSAQMRRNLKLAERLGAQSIVLTGERVADEILAYAIKHNISKMVVGKPAQPRWREWLRGSIVDEVIRRSGEIDVHVVKGESEQESPRTIEARRTYADWTAYAWTLAVMTGCTALAWVLSRLLSPANLTMVYLAGVVLVATRFGTGPAALAAVLSPLLFNFFFTEPYHTFAIADTQYVFTFCVLLATGILISGLAQRVRRQNEAVRTRYLRTIALYFMSRQLAAAADAPTLARFSTRHVSDVFQGDTVVLMPDATGRLAPAAQHGAFVAEPPNEHAAAQWVFDHQQWAGWSTETLPACAAMYLPLIASGKSLGVLAFRPTEPAHLLEPDQRHLLDTFATQLAIALERAALTVEAESARRHAEVEQTRSALLSCVSHDLRTPLAAIAGSASMLLQNEADPQRRELLNSIYEEGGRLNQLVSKLLDMTRIESPGFHLASDWYPMHDLVGSALTRLEDTLRRHAVETDLPADLPLMRVDGVLLEEVLFNLFENAARYAPPGTLIRIAAAVIGEHMRIEVCDEGPGLAPGTEEAIFDKFFRARPDTDRTGTGLGLAISRAIVELHGGKIGVTNRPTGGACFWFTIPLPTEPAPAATNSAARRESEAPA